MNNKDFIRTESYSLRLKPSGAKKVTEEFNKWMKKKIPYQKQSVMWSYALLLKTRELAQYLVEKKKSGDFCKPVYTIERPDSDDIRQKILSISYTDWENMGFSKGTLHYMKKNAEANMAFTLNAHVKERLELWESI
ncbi:CRISPR-associated protein Cas1 [Methanolobus sp.]|uniref:CRISPR-associated protein Cas1 n=1 Tax=Methanolobus sp. TaxID=1874737 RepID=UPI0025E45025|nr:CRISPR-associated protein Cas1 [Methanolobus sp.]